MSNPGDEAALDQIASALNDATALVHKVLETIGTSDRVPSADEVYERLAQLYTQLCDVNNDSEMIHRYPFLLATGPDGQVGVFLEVGKIPRSVLGSPK